MADLAERTGDHEALLEARLLAATDLLELADPAFRAELEEFLRLADGVRSPDSVTPRWSAGPCWPCSAGRLTEAGRLVDQAAMLGEECGEPGARDVRTIRAGSC